MTDTEFQAFVVEKLTSLDNRLGGVENRLGGVENRLGGVENRLGGVENRLGGVETGLISLEKEVHGLRDEFYNFREEQRQENAVLRALSAQSFQHISDIKAEMIPTWKAGNVWKPSI